MRNAIACLICLAAGGAGPACADPAGSVWLPTLGMSMPGATPPPVAPPIRRVPDLAPPPAFNRPVAQPGLFPAAPAANDPVDQQKRALYQTQLQAHQRDLESRAGPSPPGAAADALANRQELNRLRLQN